MLNNSWYKYAKTPGVLSVVPGHLFCAKDLYKGIRVREENVASYGMWLKSVVYLKKQLFVIIYVWGWSALKFWLIQLFSKMCNIFIFC